MGKINSYIYYKKKRLPQTFETASLFLCVALLVCL
jgi:hypothetical protein